MKNKFFFYYFVSILTLGIFFLIGIFFLSEKDGFGYKYQSLIDYQISKIKNFDNDTEVLFLGDSSMGYSISSEEWEKITGKKTVNLALIGDYQFSGVRAFFDMVPKKKIKNIYIIANLDSWRIKSSENYYSSLKSERSIYKNFYKINENLNLYNFINIFRFYVFDNFKRDKYKISKKYDYISQGERINEEYLKKTTKFSKDQIIFSKIIDLKKIFSECSNLGINCIYLHGPILDEFCSNETVIEFRKNVNAHLKKHDIPFFEKNICIKKSHIGDGFGHVSPNYKFHYTLKYFIYITSK
jgi:hypothetical protein